MAGATEKEIQAVLNYLIQKECVLPGSALQCDKIAEALGMDSQTVKSAANLSNGRIAFSGFGTVYASDLGVDASTKEANFFDSNTKF